MFGTICPKNLSDLVTLFKPAAIATSNRDREEN